MKVVEIILKVAPLQWIVTISNCINSQPVFGKVTRWNWRSAYVHVSYKSEGELSKVLLELHVNLSSPPKFWFGVSQTFPAKELIWKMMIMVKMIKYDDDDDESPKVKMYVLLNKSNNEPLKCAAIFLNWKFINISRVL